MRKLLAILLIVLTLFSMSIPVYAAEVPSSIEISSETSIEPRADVIVFKYRTYNGVYQYRRWNETKGYWVDPEWIDV